MKRRTEAGLSMVRGDAGDRIEKFGARSEARDRQSQAEELGASNTTARPLLSQPGAEMRLMAAIVSRENMMTAYQRVMANKGAPGIDRMTVGQLKPYLVEHWPRIKEELLAGRYQPAPVRGVEIPKPGGKGMRLLGIPTVLDRLIQQAMHQGADADLRSGLLQLLLRLPAGAERPRRCVGCAVSYCGRSALRGRS
jgi:RNA-directed DNA polymerase